MGSAVAKFSGCVVLYIIQPAVAFTKKLGAITQSTLPDTSWLT